MTAASGLDSFRLDILANALNAIAEEIQLTILRTAYSHNVKEGHDASSAIFTSRGHICAQAVAIPGHLGSMKYMIAEVLKSFPTETLQDGDVIISNDPYRGGGHLPDVGLFRPIFEGGRCIAISGCMVHHTDVGGMVPASNPVKATELYQEGLVLPPTKLRHAGKDDVGVINIIRANVRQPDIMLGDLRAQEAATLTGERRFRRVVERYGADAIVSAMEAFLDYSERKGREAVRAIPNGVYDFEDFMDHDGINLDKPVRLKCRLEVRDDSLKFDFTGSNPQVEGPINSPIGLTWATIFCGVSCILPEDIPFNEGLTRMIELVAPVGTIVNPRHPAAVNARSVTLQRIFDAVLGALAKAVPERVGAQASGSVCSISFGGVDPRTGENFVFYEAYCGALGGTRAADGADGVSCGVSNPANIPAEAVEMDYPVRVHRFELIRDSGGAGEYRGGLGLRREYEMLADKARLNVRGERAVFAPRGVHGGHDGRKSTAFLEESAGKFTQIPIKYAGQIQGGHRLILETPGAGGYGDPKGRTRERMESDLADHKFSAERLKSEFGVDLSTKANTKQG